MLSTIVRWGQSLHLMSVVKLQFLQTPQHMHFLCNKHYLQFYITLLFYSLFFRGFCYNYKTRIFADISKLITSFLKLIQLWVGGGGHDMELWFLACRNWCAVLGFGSILRPYYQTARLRHREVKKQQQKAVFTGKQGQGGKTKNKNLKKQAGVQKLSWQITGKSCKRASLA